jgi:hypothetical protein
MGSSEFKGEGVDAVEKVRNKNKTEEAGIDQSETKHESSLMRQSRARKRQRLALKPAPFSADSAKAFKF